MSFLWPVMLFSLLLIPILIGLYIRLQRKRRKAAAALGNLGLLQGTAGQKIGSRRIIPLIFFGIGLTLLLVALARPQAVLALPRVEGTVILAFDVSGSMAADDLKPTRMEAAIAAAHDFVAKQPITVQIGVVAFSDGGFSVQVPTNDQGIILGAIDRLVPQRGTSVGNGIMASLKAIDAQTAQPNRLYSTLPTAEPTATPTPMPQGSYSSAAIILLSDGSNNEPPDPLLAAQTAADRGVRIYTVGIGSVAGTTVHINGFNIHTQLNEDLLNQIAQTTGGTYFNAENEQELRTIYDNLTPQLLIKPQKTEITSMLAGASILVMLIGGIFSLAWFSRLP